MPRSTRTWLPFSVKCSPKASRKWATILRAENIYKSRVREGTEPGNERLNTVAVNYHLILIKFSPCTIESSHGPIVSTRTGSGLRTCVAILNASERISNQLFRSAITWNEEMSSRSTTVLEHTWSQRPYGRPHRHISKLSNHLSIIT